MLKVITILAAFVVLASAAVVPQWEGRVVGGQTATPGQFPWIVSVRYRQYNVHFCGAAVITNRHVLSAAHCFEGVRAIDLVLVVAAHHISNDGTRVYADSIASHESYNLRGEQEYDIAVVKTFTAIPDFARKVIPLASRAPIAGETVTVAGWGYTWYGDGKPTTSPEYLQYLSKKIITNAACAAGHGYPAPPSTVCTESPKGQGSCMGDSGGPLVNQNKELVGVVSWGIPCAQGYPDMFGNVYYLRSWILPRMV